MKSFVASYIVRIYHGNETVTNRLIGIVEKVGEQGWQKPFHTQEEIVHIIKKIINEEGSLPGRSRSREKT